MRNAAAAGERPAVAAARTAGARSTVRDHLWIFTVPAGLDNDESGTG